MKKLFLVTLMLLGLWNLIFAQTPAELTSLQQKFRSFDYDGVIELANEFLTRPDQYTAGQLVRIYEMKAIAHYSKSELDASEYAFLSILRLDSTYSPDPVKTSPKIITFFNLIKKDNERQITIPEEQTTESTVGQDTVTVVQQTLGIYQKSIPVSLVLPGAGHFIMGDKKRGVVLTSLSLLTLSSAIYFTGQTRTKEQDYMNAIDEDKIASLYNSYNNAFKTRNTVWFAYAAVWVYAQTDLIFFHEKRQKLQLVALPSFSSNLAFVSLTLSF